jgi:hypothetical protein
MVGKLAHMPQPPQSPFTQRSVDGARGSSMAGFRPQAPEILGRCHWRVPLRTSGLYHDRHSYAAVAGEIRSGRRKSVHLPGADLSKRGVERDDRETQG